MLVLQNKNMQSFLKNSSIILINTLLLFIFIEITVRFATSIRYSDFKYLTYGFKFNNTIYSTIGIPNYRPYTRGYFAFPNNKIFNKLDWSSKPLKINNLGLRGPDINLIKELNTYRIVTMGASSTFGYTVNDDETYAAVLQDILNENFLNNNFEVINAGLPWFSTKDILVLFENLVIKLNPSIVTFYIGFNDASYLLRNELILKKFGKILGNLHLGFKKFSEYSYLGHYFFYRIDRKLSGYFNVFEKPIKLKEFNQIYENIIISFSNNLIKINSICNKNKINCYFISQISSPIPTYKKLNNKIKLKQLKN